jgi:outer membrane protein insertion porin family
MYKFININFDKNTTDSVAHGLIANIRTSQQKKFQATEEAGMNISSAGWLPGPFGSLNFKTRNTFGGFELLEASVRASILGQAAVLNPSEVYRSTEYNADVSVTFPQFFFPTGLRHKLEDYSPRTKFIGGYNLVDRPEYKRKTIKVNMNYIFTQGQNTTWNFSLFDMNLINTTIKLPAFSQYLKDLKNGGNNLYYSFRTSIVSDINGSYTYNNNQLGSNKKSQYFKLYVESGGTTLNALQPLLTSVFTPDSMHIGKGRYLQTFKYFKVNADFRLYYPVGKKNTFVIRFTAGYAPAYDNEQVLPYEKYFFMGGSNSMRAWQTRRLGPGSYVARDTVNGKPIGAVNYKFEQPGQLMFENNYEYRFHIISFLEGAAFVDLGNLWSLRADTSRPGAEFKLNKFYKQIAVGTGVGMRLNFSFLILRLDFAVKAVDPAQPGSNFVLFTRTGYRDPQFNIGIGYPF